METKFISKLSHGLAVGAFSVDAGTLALVALAIRHDVITFDPEAANGKGSGMKTLGDILGGVGKIGLSAGLSGASPFGTPAVTNFTPGTANGAFGAGGYTGMGPFTTASQAGSGLYKLFG